MRPQLIGGRDDSLGGVSSGHPDAPPSHAALTPNQRELAGGQQLAPLSTLPRGCWEITVVPVQNLSFWLPVESPPAGAEARFLLITRLPGESVISAANVLTGSGSDGANWDVEW